MTIIKSFPFDTNKFDAIRKYEYGKNWPVVYLIEDKKEIYVGETTAAYSRSKQHFENPERSKLKEIHIITDEEYNKSATLDIESSLIQYLSADGKYKLQNGNEGIKNHNYFDKAKYRAKFELIWKQLQTMGIAHKELHEIRNSDLFKFSPYKALTEDQLIVAEEIFNNLKLQKNSSLIINGKPGTGKTILAIYLIKLLQSKEETKHLKVALVVPMTALRKTLQKVFRGIPGLKSSVVIGPNEVIGENYDILLVDEAHRLKRRKNIVNYGSFDITNKKLGLDNSGNELDWIVKSSKQQIFFYDKNQSVKPSDIRPEDFAKLNNTNYSLVSQQRILAGEEYTDFIDNIFDLKDIKKNNFKNYDLKLYENISDMQKDIKEKNAEMGLCRLVAGYAWDWKSKTNKNTPDIEIENTKLFWNSQMHDWVNSPNAINEVGCIHTVQGYDLNYVGVIIGPEISYDDVNNELIINKKEYKDFNGSRGIEDPEELKFYIINIYKTLLTRGIRGTYIYIVDEKLRVYFKKVITSEMSPVKIESIVSDLIPRVSTIKYTSIPLVGFAPCGNTLLGEENIEDYIDVEESKIKKGFNYFILRAKGDSMNLAGIEDEDLVLCRQQLKAETGDRVVALLGDNVTIKMYDKRDGRRILLPKSTNPKHQPILPEEGDSVQGVVQEVLKDINS